MQCVCVSASRPELRKGAKVRLVVMHALPRQVIDWPEGNYRTTDTPFPRGEVIIGGPVVTLGYWRNEEKTKEVFSVREGGGWGGEERGGECWLLLNGECVNE